MWLLIVAIITFGPLYAQEIYIYISCHVLYLLLKTLWRTLALFAYRWYDMRFYLRNWGESTNLEIVPHSGPYKFVLGPKVHGSKLDDVFSPTSCFNV